MWRRAQIMFMDDKVIDLPFSLIICGKREAEEERTKKEEIRVKRNWGKKGKEKKRERFIFCSERRRMGKKGKSRGKKRK
jgi:hypothetical protein